VERPSEYTLDRKNREIEELKQQLKEADNASTMFATAFVVTLMVSILFVLYVFTSRGA
jgi:CHASE3 domain sensor protein